MEKPGRKSMLVVVAGALLALLPSAESARADVVTVGVCHLTVETTQAFELPPSTPSAWEVHGSGPCLIADTQGVDAGSPYTGTLAASSSSAVGVGCLTGVGVTGGGTFTLTRSGFPSDVVLTIAVAAAGVLTVGGVEGRFAGTGVFVPRTGSAHACASSATRMRWGGPFVFEQHNLSL